MEKLDELYSQYFTYGKQLINEHFSEFFKQNPGVTCVNWVQYTPTFNDGDACEFTVGELIFSNTLPEDREGLRLWGNEEYTMDTSPLDLCRLISHPLMEPILKDRFGNCVTIWATRDGFEVSNYWD